ncbi:MAG: SRPBCC domain-containing protein [Thermoleophilia bacterium]
MSETNPRKPTAAVLEATGRTWNEWFLFLDSERAYDFGHKAIVALLENYIESVWWRQTVAVEYEKIHGLRVTGQTAGGSFQVGASKTLAMPPKKAWELLVSRNGMHAWLGAGVRANPKTGQAYATRDGITGEFRVVKKMSHLRLSWQPQKWDKPSMLQIRVVPGAPGKTTISFHHESLPGAREREEMKLRWRQVLLALEEIASH